MGLRSSSAAPRTIGASVTSCTTYPTMCGASCATTAFSACSSRKEHGGLGFSAQAQSLILGKIASRSPDGVTIVMVPNSLGPGELIEKYGTDEQKEHYPAAPRARRGDAVLRADRADLRLGCGHHARYRLRHARPARGQGDDRHQALAGTSATSRWRPMATLVGLAFRLFDPGEHARPRRGYRHHARRCPGQPSRRQDRPAASAGGRRVPQRPELGQGRLHPDGLGDRRRRDGRAGLAHADGVPRRGPLDLAAVVGGRRRQGDAAQHHRLRPHPQAVRPADRQAWKASRSRWRAWSRRPTSTRRRAR